MTEENSIDSARNEIFDLFKDNPKDSFLKFIQKYSWVVLLLLLLFVNFDMRNQNIDLEMTDNWAYDNIKNNYINSQLSQLNSKYSNVDDRAKLDVAQKNWLQFESQNKQLVEEQSKIFGQQLRDGFQNPDGDTYLIAIDPYYYYRQLENLNNTGYGGSLIIGDESYDHLQNAPKVDLNPLKVSLHPYFSFYTYKFLNLFTDISLYKTFFIIPSILIGLAIIFAFLVGKQVAGTLGGFIFAYIITFHNSILGRTVSGFSDTDAYTIWLPIMIIYFLFNGFMVKSFKWKLVNIILSGFSVGLFSFAWTGYWYIADIIIASLLIYIAILLIIEFKNNKNILSIFKKNIELRNVMILFLIFIVSIILFVSIFNNFDTSLRIIDGPLSFLTLKEATGGQSLWPNVFHTVAELNPSDLQKTLSSISLGSYAKGLFLSILGLVGLFLVFLDKKNECFNIKIAIFGLLWYIVLVWTTFSGVRFIMTAIPAFAFIVALFFGKLSQLCQNFAKNELHLSKIVTSLIFILLSIMFINFLFPASTSYSQAESAFPSMNDAWDGALNKIATQTHNDTIITSWWDFGHQFITVGKRGTTFDGGSQNGPNAHWVGRALLTNDEGEAKGILNMLHCSNNRFTEELEKQNLSQFESIKLTKELILMSKEDAYDRLVESNLNADSLINMTHCNPQDGIFITSQDMVGKAGVWSHFGIWDFDKALLWTKKDEPRQEQLELLNNLGYSEIDSNNFVKDIENMKLGQVDGRGVQNWIAPWPTYITSSPCQKNNQLVNCNIGFSVGGQNIQGSFIYDTQTNISSGTITPLSFSHLSSDYDINTIDFESANLNFAFVLYENNGALQIMVMSKELSESMFTRLYFLKGYGLKYFKSFDERYSMFNSKISTWTVDWDSDEKLLPEGREYDVSHILIAYNGSERSSSIRSKEKALDLTKELKSKININNFEALAINYSDDISVQQNSGNLGWSDLGGYIPEFSNAVRQLNKGEFGDIIETVFGYHIIYLKNVRIKNLDIVLD